MLSISSNKSFKLEEGSENSKGKNLSSAYIDKPSNAIEELCQANFLLESGRSAINRAEIIRLNIYSVIGH